MTLPRDLSGGIRPPEGRASLRSFKEKYTNIFIKKIQTNFTTWAQSEKAELSNGHWEGAPVKATHFVVKGNGWRRGCHAGSGEVAWPAPVLLGGCVCLSVSPFVPLTQQNRPPGATGQAGGSPGSACDARVKGGPAAGPSPPARTHRHRPPRPGFRAPGDDVTEHSGVLWCIYCRVSSSSNSCYPGPPLPTRLPFWRPDDQRCPCRSPDSRHWLRSTLSRK